MNGWHHVHWQLLAFQAKATVKQRMILDNNKVWQQESSRQIFHLIATKFVQCVANNEDIQEHVLKCEDTYQTVLYTVIYSVTTLKSKQQLQNSNQPYFRGGRMPVPSQLATVAALQYLQDNYSLWSCAITFILHIISFLCYTICIINCVGIINIGQQRCL